MSALFVYPIASGQLQTNVWILKNPVGATFNSAVWFEGCVVLESK